MAYRSRPRPSSALGAKASTTCPYYLDGDLFEPISGLGDYPLTQLLIVKLGECGYCAVFKGRARGRPLPAARWLRERPCRSLKTQQHAPARDPRVAARPRARSHAMRRRTSGQARFGRHTRPLGRSRRSPLATERIPLPAPTARFRAGPVMGLPRKEVIQPHLPVRLPCYDFTPVTSPTLDGSLPCGLGHRLWVLLTPVV